VETCCDKVQQALVEAAGEIELLGASEQAHLRQCTLCSEVAVGERALHGILAQVVPPHDELLEQRILSAIPAHRARWRMVSLLPVAASLLVTLAGATLVGGVPGSSLLALLPAWSSQGWWALFGLASDWGVVLTATARAAGTTVPVTAQVTAGLLSLAGLAATVGMARRWWRGRLWARAD